MCKTLVASSLLICKALSLKMMITFFVLDDFEDGILISPIHTLQNWGMSIRPQAQDHKWEQARTPEKANP